MHSDGIFCASAACFECPTCQFLESVVAACCLVFCLCSCPGTGVSAPGIRVQNSTPRQTDTTKTLLFCRTTTNATTYSCAALVVFIQVIICSTVQSVSRLPLLLLQVCVALKVLAAGNSFQDVATFSGMSVKAAETSFHLFCEKFLNLNQHASKFHQSREQIFLRPIPSVQRKFFWQKFPTESCQKKKLFEGTFACHNKRC